MRRFFCSAVVTQKFSAHGRIIFNEGDVLFSKYLMVEEGPNLEEELEKLFRANIHPFDHRDLVFKVQRRELPPETAVTPQKLLELPDLDESTPRFDRRDQEELFHIFMREMVPWTESNDPLILEESGLVAKRKMRVDTDDDLIRVASLHLDGVVFALVVEKIGNKDEDRDVFLLDLPQAEKAVDAIFLAFRKASTVRPNPVDPNIPMLFFDSYGISIVDGQVRETNSDGK